MARDFLSLLARLSFSTSPPFIKCLPSQSLILNNRLELITFFGADSAPKRYLVRNFRGRAGRLSGAETLRTIVIPVPSIYFRRILTPSSPDERHSLGRYIWSWTKDQRFLVAYDEMRFFFTPDDAKLLDRVFFGANADSMSESEND